MPGGAIILPSASNRKYLKSRQLIFPLGLASSLFFLWGFSYGLLDVLNKHFQNVLKITKLESTGLQIVYFGGGYFCFSPIAAELLKRKGYKITIIIGLPLFALGAIFFWPTAHFSNPTKGKQAFGGFIVCTFVISCGLGTLETAANSYTAVIGDPQLAAIRLQFCASWNGVASFIGPLIAPKLFFSAEHATNLAQFCYVGAQVTIASFFINYATENADFTDSQASKLLSYALITFTVSRFLGTVLSHFFQADFILLIYSTISIALTIYVSIGYGRSAVIVLMSIYFFESLMFPIIFAMGTANLGRHTRRGAGILIMGVSDDAVFPPIQGVIADAHSTRISFLVPMIGFIVVLAYALFHWIKHGFKVRCVRSTVNNIIDVQPKLSHVSRPTDIVNHILRSTLISPVPKTYVREYTNGTVIITEYF
ncbi:unnamed protein product [Rotaria sordida]|uniref:Uncharacterized protein n=1 Tax=Rotaria sordida TaxID=392033 RepID=A0A814WAQ5_9BILA|nr:unnamed protein product [Rotaria sordida]